MNTLLVRFLPFILATVAVAQVPRKTSSVPHKRAESCVAVEDGAFQSASLEQEMKYRVMLPCSYRDGGRFPVLYLLHGLHGDYLNWDTQTNLERYVKEREIIVVMPDAGDSWYTNSVANPRDKFEDYIAQDLVAEIDGKFRTISARHKRAIAGLSMGGYGAIKIGLHYHDSFTFAGSLSGALDAAQDLDKERPDFRDKLLEVFGAPGSPARRNNDVFDLLRNARADDIPYFYLGCGSGDDFLEVNRKFAAELSSREFPYEYHETPGKHAWDYWDGALGDLLRAASRIMSK